MEQPTLLVGEGGKFLFTNRAGDRSGVDFETALRKVDGGRMLWLSQSLRSTAPIPFQLTLGNGNRVRATGQRIRLAEYPNALALLRVDLGNRTLVQFRAVRDQLHEVTETLRAERRRTRTLAARANKLDKIARTDQLTGLMTRPAFETAVADAMNSGGADNSILLMLDLDGFKQVNDAHGHHAGDHVLKVIGQRLLSVVRDSDMAARFGGDEFCVYLAGPLARGNAETVVSRIYLKLSEPELYNGFDKGTAGLLRVSASIGVVRADPRAGDLHSLLHQADRAMYQSKKSADRRPVWHCQGEGSGRLAG